MIIINVKYMSATNTKGSRFKATMRGRNGKLSATVPYNYELGDGGIREAAHKVLAKWCAEIDHGGDETWTLNLIGEDQNYETIVTAHVTHEVSA